MASVRRTWASPDQIKVSAAYGEAQCRYLKLQRFANWNLGTLELPGLGNRGSCHQNATRACGGPADYPCLVIFLFTPGNFGVHDLNDIQNLKNLSFVNGIESYFRFKFASRSLQFTSSLSI